MSQLKILKYCYQEQGTFEVRDEHGTQCWIKFEQATEESIDSQSTAMPSLQNIFKPIPIEQGY